MNTPRRDTCMTLAVGFAAGMSFNWLCAHVVKPQLKRLMNMLSSMLSARASSAGAFHPFCAADRLSLVAQAKRPAPLRSLLPLTKIDGMVCLSGGIPPASLFPIKSYTLELVDGGAIHIDDPQLVAKAQQYMHDVTPGLGTIGYSPLLTWIKQFTKDQHAPPYEGWECCVCTGNLDGFMRCWELVLDPGDTLLIDEMNFAFSVSQLCAWTGARNLHVEPCKLGAHGIDAEALSMLLENWGTMRPALPFPKALFTIPCMQNPTCVDVNNESVQAIYSICKQHGIFIIEDDPYRLLFFGETNTRDEAPVPGLSGQLPPSFLSVDTDGLVLRCDTFSKWISPGLRCGWVTAPKAAILKIGQGSGSSLGVASSVQIHLMALLQHWGMDGLHNHVCKVQRAYRHRCSVLNEAANKYLHGLAEWVAPRGGMFMWVKLLGVTNSVDLLEEMKAAKVVVVPGAYFYHDGADEGKHATPFVRISYSDASDAMLVEGMKRLGEVLQRRSGTSCAK